MEVTDMEFQSIVPSIQNGEYDFSIAAMYKTDERCEVVDMSKSYCDSGMILAVKEDSEYADTVKSLADCDGLKVAVKEGATSYNVAQSFLDENPDVSYEIVQYKDTGKLIVDVPGRIGYVSQFYTIEREKEVTVFDYISEEFVRLQNKINQICEDMAVTDHLEELMEEYQQTLDEFNAIDGDFYESNIRKQLKTAGLAGYEDQLLTNLSGN